jgi:hypothetical protein
MAKLLTSFHDDEMAALRRAASQMRADGEHEALAALLLRDALIAGCWLDDGYGWTRIPRRQERHRARLASLAPPVRAT